MNWLIAGLILAWIFTICDYWRFYHHTEREKKELQTKLDAAEKKLIDLEGQTPGRDKSGRFVKRDKVSLQKV